MPATAAQAMARIESHEEICTLRHKTINDKLDDLKADGRRTNGLGLAVLLAILGWVVVQLVTPVLHPAAPISSSVSIAPAPVAPPHP